MSWRKKQTKRLIVIRIMHAYIYIYITKDKDSFGFKVAAVRLDTR